MKRILSLILVILYIMFIPSEALAAIKSYDISKTKKVVVTENDKIKFTLPSKYKNVKWTSSDKKIATISKNGTLTTMLSGKITVTAKSGKNSFKCTVTIKEDYSEWIPYDTYDLETLADNIIAGYVVRINGQYYCSPEYYEMISNAEIVYENDISDGKYYDKGGMLTPTTEFVIEDDENDDKSDADALKKRIQGMIESGKATSD